MKLSRFPLSTLLDSASGHLETHLLQKKEAATNEATGSSPYAGIIFSGNPHETVPRRLLLDDRLTPLERNAWQVFRLLINDDGLTAFPTYDQLRPYLGMQPGKPASRETISKSLITLRLTRWLSLGRRVRSDLSGQVQGNVYLLHDEPVSPAEAIEFDKDYLQLLNHSLKHQNKTIREVAEIAWNEFAQDPDVGSRLPTRLDALEERLTAQRWVKDVQGAHMVESPEFGIRTQGKIPQESLDSESELSDNWDECESETPSSDSEPSGNPRSTPSVRNPNSYSTYTNTNQDVCKSSVHVLPERAGVEAGMLEALHRLQPDEKHHALQALQKIPIDVRPDVLSQWVHRVETGSLRNPLGYLLSLVSRAVRGEFNSNWSPEPSPATNGAPPDAPKHVEPGDNLSTDPIAPPSQTEPPSVKSPEARAKARRELDAMLSAVRFGRPDA
jgi:hypothetical protein